MVLIEGIADQLIYFRGKETCGDIDILITRKDGKSSSGFIQKLVKR